MAMKELLTPDIYRVPSRTDLINVDIDIKMNATLIFQKTGRGEYTILKSKWGKCGVFSEARLLKELDNTRLMLEGRY